jgi:iron complex outermembrane receptor protein
MKRDYRRRDWVLNNDLNVPVSTLGSAFYEALPYSRISCRTSTGHAAHLGHPDHHAFYNSLFTPAVAAQPVSAADARNSFVVDQKITSGYVRGDFRFDAIVPISGNIGVRYARTEQVASGTLTSTDSQNPVLTPVSYPQDYGNWLPSLNVKVDLRDDLIARFAASRVSTGPTSSTAPRASASRATPPPPRAATRP